jgi:hypothetical protein
MNQQPVKRLLTAFVCLVLLFVMFVPSPALGAVPTVPESVTRRFNFLSEQFPMIGAAFRDIRAVSGVKYAALVNPPVIYVNTAKLRCTYIYCPGRACRPEIALTYQWGKRLHEWLKAVYPGRLQHYERAFPGQFADAFVRMYYLGDRPRNEATIALEKMLRAMR